MQYYILMQNFLQNLLGFTTMSEELRDLRLGLEGESM